MKPMRILLQRSLEWYGQWKCISNLSMQSTPWALTVSRPPTSKSTFQFLAHSNPHQRLEHKPESAVVSYQSTWSPPLAMLSSLVQPPIVAISVSWVECPLRHLSNIRNVFTFLREFNPVSKSSYAFSARQILKSTLALAKRPDSIRIPELISFAAKFLFKQSSDLVALVFWLTLENAVRRSSAKTNFRSDECGWLDKGKCCQPFTGTHALPGSLPLRGSALPCWTCLNC